MKEDECYLCETPMSSSYFKRAVINGEPLIIEICPECYHVFKYDSRADKEDYILKKGLNMRGIRL